MEVATVRKLEFENDAFAFGDKLIAGWYPKDQRDNKGILLVVTSAKDGALTGGAGFMKVRCCQCCMLWLPVAALRSCGVEARGELPG